MNFIGDIVKEIKFKYYFQHDDTGTNVSKTLTLNEIGSCKLSVISIELGVSYGNHFAKVQYTGLKDKNGVEIYEGDIVNLHFEDEYSNDCVLVDGLTTKVAKVKFDYQGAYGEESDSTWYYFADLISNEVEIEVIGNIYENKDLL